MLERRHPQAKCEECPLSRPEEKAIFVPSRFPTGPARLAVVGEAPGYQEARRGEPFVGPSGQLLDQVLLHHGYNREEVFLTNVCLCRPKDNATPSRAAITACRERLIGEITQSGCRDVVGLGGTAASVLVDDSRTITALRVGPARPPSSSLRGSNVERVVPTWHPAYCLRNADAFPALVSDIGKLKDVNTHVWSPPDWRYFNDPSEGIRVLDELQGRADRLVVDIEVGVEKDLSFGHPNDYDLLCVGLAYARGKAVVLGAGALADRNVLDRLGELLRNKRIIAHNGKFDLAGLYPHLGGQELWFDTMLASYCLDERPGQHGLKVLAVEKLGAPQYDLEIHKYVPKGGNYANIPPEILYKYNAFDVACTWDLMELFEPAMEREGVRRVHDFLVAASNQLMYLELNGITIDRPYLNQLRGEFLLRLEVIESSLNEIVGDSINPRSPMQVKNYLGSQGVKVDKTDKDTLSRILDILYRQGHYDANVAKFISELLTHRKQQKLFSTYVEGMRRRISKGRLFTTYTLHGTTSGRLASRNPNLQNIVRDKPIRKQFTVSKPENVLVHADYKQAEGRVIATLAGDEYLRGIFSDPTIDMFDELSDQLYGIGNWAKEERIRTKAFFYGIGYGREPYSIGLEYGMSPSEAKRRYQEFMDLIPAVARWQSDVRRKVLNGEDLTTPFGRKRRFWLITEENKKAVENEALSYLPQSTASDICLSALVDLRPMLRGRGFLRLTIHDALIAECHQDKRDEVAGLMREVMMEKGRLFTDYVPFPVDISTGTSWDQL